jgi:protein-S-isoprenylcysteine O-methyltransferase Ste14
MNTHPAGRQAIEDERPGVIGRPILMFLVTFPLALALDHLLPLVRPIPSIGPVHWVSGLVGVCMTLIGIGVIIAGIRNLRQAGTLVPTNQPARTLVTTAIHGWTRNPIYLGFLLVVLGTGILIRSPWILILTVPLAMYFRYGVIAREEVYLERRFADPYRDYKACVRRWL